MLSIVGCSVITSCVTTFASLTQTLNRRTREMDTCGKKCCHLLISILSIIFIIGGIAIYHGNCHIVPNNEGRNPSYSFGFISFVLCLLTGNIPWFIINLLIPLPLDFENGVQLQEEELEGSAAAPVASPEGQPAPY